MFNIHSDIARLCDLVGAIGISKHSRSIAIEFDHIGKMESLESLLHNQTVEWVGYDLLSRITGNDTITIRLEYRKVRSISECLS